MLISAMVFSRSLVYRVIPARLQKMTVGKSGILAASEKPTAKMVDWVQLKKLPWRIYSLNLHSGLSSCLRVWICRTLIV